MTSYQINYHAPTSGGCESSTYVGATVKVRGYVSAVDNNGFYMQDNPTSAPYEGMFVYTTSGGGWLIGRAVGQLVEVVAVVFEYYDLTELKDLISLTVISSGHAMVPLVATTGAIGTACTASGEAHEGLLVTVNNVQITSEPNQYGEIGINDGSGETQLEDGILNTVLHLGAQAVAGTSIRQITGVVRYAFGSFEIHPRSAADITVSGVVSSPPPSTAPVVSSPSPPPGLRLDNSSASQEQGPPGSDNTALIVVIVIAVVVALIAVAVAIVVVRRGKGSGGSGQPKMSLGAPTPVEVQVEMQSAKDDSKI